MNKYQQTMENVEMSDEMRNRILDSVNEEFDTKKKRVSIFAWSRLGKFIPLVACVVIIAIPALYFLNSGNRSAVSFEAGLVDDFVNAAKDYKDNITLAQQTDSELYWDMQSYTSYYSSASAQKTGTFTIVSNVAQEYGYSSNGNGWEQILCEGENVMLFANERTMETFIGIDIPNVNFSVSSLLPKDYVFQLNGVVSEYYKQGKNIVVYSTAPSKQINISEMNSDENVIMIKTAVGDVSVSDDTSEYFAAWWEKENMVYWLYSRNKYSTEWLLNLLGRASE